MHHLRRNTPSFSRRAKGFTIIELVIGIVVSVIILAGGAAAVSNLLGKSDVSQDIQGIASLTSNVKNLRGAGGYGTSGTNLLPTLIAMDAVPKSLTVNGTTVTNAWGGAVSVASTGVGYSVTSAGIPKEACIEEAAKLSRGSMTTKVGSAAAVAGEITTVAATTSCSAATNTIVWTSAN